MDAAEATTGESVLAELRHVVASLAEDGGLGSASVYDTARLICLAPQVEDIEPAIAWLLAEQRADGGWGDPELPIGRDVSTLAAVLALRVHCDAPAIRDVVGSALEFVAAGAECWGDLRADAFPVAAEMVMPCLVDEANRAGLQIPTEPYRQLFTLREKKLRALDGYRVEAGTPAAHSWETLGRGFDPALPDGSGGVGHSPAATAAWLGAAEERPQTEAPRSAARRFLARSQRATGLDLPGVVPTVWPYPGFDEGYGLYFLLLNDLLDHPALEALVSPLVARLAATFERGGGLGMSPDFVNDGDLTSTAVAVLARAEGRSEFRRVLHFRHKDHFCTYAGEQTPSLLSNAHAVFALACCDRRHPPAEAFLLEQQTAGGYWLSEKWHSSWRYATMEVIAALAPLGHRSAMKKTLGAFLTDQHQDGGWGMGARSIPTETAFCVGALQILQQHGLSSEQGDAALTAGRRWLLDNYRPYAEDQGRHWIGKELYAQPRINRLYELCILFRDLSRGDGR